MTCLRDGSAPAGRRRVLFVQFAHPALYPPVRHGASLLAERGWRVRVLGARHPLLPPLDFPTSSSLRATIRAVPAPGWRLKLAYVRFLLHALGIVVGWRPRWVYASDLFATPIALLASLCPGVRILYHEHDAPVGAGSPVDRFFGVCRALAVRRAECCVAPNRRRAAQLETSTGLQGAPIVVPNMPRREEALAEPERENGAREFRLAYQGSLVPARLPPSVIEALARLPEGFLLVVGGFETNDSAGYGSDLLAVARRLRVAGRVKLHGPCRRAEMLARLRAAHAGLSIFSAAGRDFNEASMVGASNKPYEYLACGLPLVVPDEPEWRTAFIEPGLGVACDPDDPDSIAAAVRRLAADRVRARQMGERGRARVLREWNYEAHFRPVIERLEGLR